MAQPSTALPEAKFVPAQRWPSPAQHFHRQSLSQLSRCVSMRNPADLDRSGQAMACAWLACSMAVASRRPAAALLMGFRRQRARRRARQRARQRVCLRIGSGTGQHARPRLGYGLCLAWPLPWPKPCLFLSYGFPKATYKSNVKSDVKGHVKSDVKAPVKQNCFTEAPVKQNCFT